MTHHEAFLQSIIEAPDDDTPRLICADWLDDQGQHDRATFIRVQCELAQARQGDSRQALLAAREHDLLKRYGQLWSEPLLRPLAGMVTGWRFSRGFIEKVTLEARGFQQHADELFRFAPVRDVTLHLSRSRISQLAFLPRLARLVRLNLHGNSLGAEGVQVLAGSPFLTGLTELRLSWNDIGDDGAQALADSPNLSRLCSLALYVNNIGETGAVALARSAHLSGLVSLDLVHNAVGRAGRSALEARFGARVRLSEGI